MSVPIHEIESPSPARLFAVAQIALMEFHADRLPEDVRGPLYAVITAFLSDDEAEAFPLASSEVAAVIGERVALRVISAVFAPGEKH
jgi:hypothetical protein